MRRSNFGRARDIAPLGEKAGTISKLVKLVFNERKGR